MMSQRTLYAQQPGVETIAGNGRGKTQTYTDMELIQAFRAARDKLGRWPTQVEYDRLVANAATFAGEQWPNRSTIERRLGGGSWNAAKQRAERGQ
jgi:Homing endonuclease associated repeat